MPVFECSRCNNLTYSASRLGALVCEICGAGRQRVLEPALTFEEARAMPRELVRGDHCCITYDDAEEVDRLTAAILRHGLGRDALVIAYPPAAVRALLDEQLGDDERDAIEWREPESVYGPGFDCEAVVAHFREIAESEDRPVYVVGGSERPLEEVVDAEEFERFERLATDTAIELGMVVACLFDSAVHDGIHVHAAHATHPLATRGGPVRRNPEFVYA